MEFFIIGAIAVVLFVIVFGVDKWLDKKDAEKKSVEPKRARNDKGHFVADDPSTPDVNEAWEGGKAPKKTKAKSKPKKKKTTRKKKAVKRSINASDKLK